MAAEVSEPCSALLEAEGLGIAREAALAVVDEQQRPAARQQDQVLVAVVVHVGEERLRRAVEHRHARGLGDVLERAVALVPEEPVGQAFGLRDVEVVRARRRRSPPPRRRGVPCRRGMNTASSDDDPVIEPRDELPAERLVAPERRLGHLGEDGRGGAAAQVLERRPTRSTRHGSSAPRRQRICQRPSRWARPPSLCGPARSKRTVVRRRAAPRPFSTSMAVIRNSAVAIEAKSLDERGQLLAEGGAAQRRSRQAWRGPRKTSSCGLLPTDDFLGRRQATALELGRQQQVGRLGVRCTCSSRSSAPSSHRARRASSSAVFSSGNASCPARGALMTRLERRRHAVLGLVAVRLRRRDGRTGRRAPGRARAVSRGSTLRL